MTTETNCEFWGGTKKTVREEGDWGWKEKYTYIAFPKNAEEDTRFCFAALEDMGGRTPEAMKEVREQIAAQITENDYTSCPENPLTRKLTGGNSSVKGQTLINPAYVDPRYISDEDRKRLNAGRKMFGQKPLPAPGEPPLYDGKYVPGEYLKKHPQPYVTLPDPMLSAPQPTQPGSATVMGDLVMGDKTEQNGIKGDNNTVGGSIYQHIGTQGKPAKKKFWTKAKAIWAFLIGLATIASAVFGWFALRQSRNISETPIERSNPTIQQRDNNGGIIINNFGNGDITIPQSEFRNDSRPERNSGVVIPEELSESDAVEKR